MNTPISTTDVCLTPLQKAIRKLGPYKVAALCGVKGPSVYKWDKNGYLPRTEWTGETRYAEAIAAAVEDCEVTVETLRMRPAPASPPSPTEQVPS